MSVANLNDLTVRLQVYRHFVDIGEPPTADQTAAALGLPPDEIERPYRRLHEGHMLVLAPNSVNIRMAMPLAAVPTAYRVTVDDRSWWAN